MEDKFLFDVELPKSCKIFGVFDGHGGYLCLKKLSNLGPEVSQFAANHFIE